MLKVKVRNMEGRNGNAVPNQFDITVESGRYFQSYQSIIAYRPWDKKKAIRSFKTGEIKNEAVVKARAKHDIYPTIYLDYTTWDYSNTTGRYRNQFLNETKKETQDRIDGGEYALVDLN